MWSPPQRSEVSPHSWLKNESLTYSVGKGEQPMALPERLWWTLICNQHTLTHTHSLNAKMRFCTARERSPPFSLLLYVSTSQKPSHGILKGFHSQEVWNATTVNLGAWASEGSENSCSKEIGFVNPVFPTLTWSQNLFFCFVLWNMW